jgi:hypothetical protein
MQSERDTEETKSILLPTPTVWPMVFALGISLMITALVTSMYVGALGLLLTIWAAVAWFLQVLPHEAHESVAVDVEEIRIASARTLIRTAHASETSRKILPAQPFRITTGLEGGIAGGIAMTIPAAIFSLLRYHSIWFAMNLLAAGGFVSWANASDAFLSQFHLQGLLAALAIHGVTSLLVGLLYGAMLMMFPRYPILTAGFMVPLLFTGILYSALGIVSPILNQRIDWFWFVPSQLVFGLVCGYVVNLKTNVRTPQFQALPFAVRAGLHGDARGMERENNRGADPQQPAESQKENGK